MEIDQLKFLLKLLECGNYRSYISGSTFRNFKGKEKICQELGNDGLVDFTREIAVVKIAPPGRALLDLDTSQLPISDQELKLLEKINKAGNSIPSKINVQIKGKRLKASERDKILQNFQDRGFIEVETKLKKTGAEVWLTERGQECLKQLNDYFQTLRKSTVTPIVKLPDKIKPPSDQEILQIIQDLDRELGTENYLEIFHLRQKLESVLSREELDEALYRLEGNDRIELSSLQEVIAYTPEQIDAGIPQDIGGPLFFIIVN